MITIEDAFFILILLFLIRVGIIMFWPKNRKLIPRGTCPYCKSTNVKEDGRFTVEIGWALGKVDHLKCLDCKEEWKVILRDNKLDKLFT